MTSFEDRPAGQSRGEETWGHRGNASRGTTSRQQARTPPRREAASPVVPVRILVVENDLAFQSLITAALKRVGYDVQVARDAEAAAVMVREDLPDLILMEWLSPGAHGLNMIRRLRGDPCTGEVPVIMLSARAAEEDKVLALQGGADDYVTKPFSPRELHARIEAVLRRWQPQSRQAAVEIGGLRLDPATHRITVRGEPVVVRMTQYLLLHFLVTHPERVHTRGQLLDSVWGINTFVEDRSVDVTINRLRTALTPSGLSGLIQTVRGSGYRLSVGPMN
jgi:two-component system phosphate regulon response regulator PhoB